MVRKCHAQNLSKLPKIKKLRSKNANSLYQSPGIFNLSLSKSKSNIN